MARKTALITGADKGLGLAMAREFVYVGGHALVAHARRWTTESRRTLPDGAVLVDGHLQDRETISRLGVVARENAIDILVNNAGEYLNYEFFPDSPDDEVGRILHVDLLSPILLTKAIWSVFRTRGSGLVVNISSLAGASPGRGEAAYGAAKAGLSAFSEALQFDAVRDGVKVVDIKLGAMKTTMTATREGRDRFIDPGEAAAVIVGLCRLLSENRTLRITSIDIKRGIY